VRAVRSTFSACGLVYAISFVELAARLPKRCTIDLSPTDAARTIHLRVGDE
jgi:hypothetical protein